MAKLYIRQHKKRGRKSCYTGIPRGSSFFVVLARCGAFPRAFPPHWKKYARKCEKGAIWGDFPPLAAREILSRHYTNKLFSFGDWQTEKADFLEIKA